MNIILRNLCLKLGCFRLCDLHAVQWTDNFNVPFCRKQTKKGKTSDKGAATSTGKRDDHSIDRQMRRSAENSVKVLSRSS